jgi:hypothetical protein
MVHPYGCGGGNVTRMQTVCERDDDGAVGTLEGRRTGITRACNFVTGYKTARTPH